MQIDVIMPSCFFYRIGQSRLGVTLCNLNTTCWASAQGQVSELKFTIGKNGASLKGSMINKSHPSVSSFYVKKIFAKEHYAGIFKNQ